MDLGQVRSSHSNIILHLNSPSPLRDVVATGIFKTENIMIGLGQGLFNFVFSTLAWFTVSQIYSLPAGVNDARDMRSLSIIEAADQVLDAFQKFEERH